MFRSNLLDVSCSYFVNARLTSLSNIPSKGCFKHFKFFVVTTVSLLLIMEKKLGYFTITHFTYVLFEGIPQNYQIYVSFSPSCKHVSSVSLLFVLMEQSLPSTSSYRLLRFTGSI